MCNNYTPKPKYINGEVPTVVSMKEAAILYEYITMNPDDDINYNFLDQRNKIIYECMKYFKLQVGYMANWADLLIDYIGDDLQGRHIDPEYLKKIFDGYKEPTLEAWL